MRKFEGFEAKKASGSRELLPVGGYVAKIMEAKELNYDWGDVLLISFDVSEGEHKDFFANDYKSQDGEDKKWRGTYRLNIPKDDGSEKDGWTKRTFGGAIWAIENSNPGFHWDWDEKKLKGKTIGVLFRNKEWEYNEKTGWTTECCALASADDIRSGKFTMPKDKPLQAKKTVSAFTPVNDVADDDLPF